jgi:hypothetical protein
MRKALLVFWLLIPIAAGAYHYGPGQERMTMDEVAALLDEAESHVQAAQDLLQGEEETVAREEWALAETAYEEALRILPEENLEENRRIRLERAKTQLNISKLPEAHGDLKTLVDELSRDPNVDPELLESSRDALANSGYYMTWLMRLEGAPREEWEPEIESARQLYKLLATTADKNGEQAVKQQHQENLEAAIRLERMDLTELQGLPIPSQ